jgi:hypothetical protein
MSVSGMRASPFNVAASREQHDVSKVQWHIQLDPPRECQLRSADTPNTTACNGSHDSKDAPMNSEPAAKPLVPNNDSCRCQRR